MCSFSHNLLSPLSSLIHTDHPVSVSTTPSFPREAPPLRTPFIHCDENSNSNLLYWRDSGGGLSPQQNMLEDGLRQ